MAINTSTQTYTSAMTSINSTKLPAIYNRLDWSSLMDCFWGQPQISVLDYGCGRYTDHIKNFCENKGFTWFGYDYTWNADKSLLDRNYDIIVCSNVLNVIKENSIIDSIREFIYNHSSIYFISVYEGNSSGIGCETKKDCWQRNALTTTYLLDGENARKKVITSKWNIMFVK